MLNAVPGEGRLQRPNLTEQDSCVPQRWSMCHPRPTLHCAVPGQHGPLSLTLRTAGTGAGRLSSSACMMQDMLTPTHATLALALMHQGIVVHCCSLHTLPRSTAGRCVFARLLAALFLRIAAHHAFVMMITITAKGAFTAAKVSCPANALALRARWLIDGQVCESSSSRHFSQCKGFLTGRQLSHEKACHSHV